LTIAIAVERYTIVCHPFFKVAPSSGSLIYELKYPRNSLFAWGDLSRIHSVQVP
jgi:hypothetical protein